MSPFIHDDFLLETETAHVLYHETAKDLPIIDYHCHLSPEAMAANHRFRSISEVWLDGDHYKWRAMRANGTPDRFCSGEASASSTASHSEPVQTPWAPSASAAAICRPVPTPPAASTGVGATASITSGQSTMLPMSPV